MHNKSIALQLLLWFTVFSATRFHICGILAGYLPGVVTLIHLKLEMVSLYQCPLVATTNKFTESVVQAPQGRLCTAHTLLHLMLMSYGK